MRQAGIGEARRVARELVHRLGIAAPEHIRIEAIARRLGARVVETQLDGAQAQLIRTPREKLIMVSDRITEQSPRRFSIAHELGHDVLEHPTTTPHMMSAASRAPRADQRDYEAEANAFASELLLPYALVNERCCEKPVSLDLPWALAREFNVSILTSARRVAELSPERCVAVFSKDGRVVWTQSSTSFTAHIASGQRLDPGSVAWEFFQHGTLDERAQPVPADAWVDTCAEVDLIEHSTASYEHRTVLSMLWAPENIAAPLGMRT